MLKSEIVFILPSYSHFQYASLTLRSLHEYSPFVQCIIVDDASPDWNDEWYLNSGGSVEVHRFDTNGGLTRSLNKGFEMARKYKPQYIIAGNNDLIFTPNWWEAMVMTLKRGLFKLVGPVTNAPGRTDPMQLQLVSKYIDYEPSDDRAALEKTANDLRIMYRHSAFRCHLNGFFMMAAARHWYGDGYSCRNVFPHTIPIMPSGRHNPAPLMAGQEDWLQSRWAKKGYEFATCPGSFVFHYRSVARGEKHACGMWMRQKEKADECGGVHVDHRDAGEGQHQATLSDRLG